MAEELLPCPREPDGKMLAAGRDALKPYVGTLKQPISDQWELARLVWAAMTEARPSQPLMGDREKIARLEKLRDRLAYQGALAKHHTGNGVAEALERSLCEESAKDAEALDAILASLPAQGGEPVASCRQISDVNWRITFVPETDENNAVIHNDSSEEGAYWTLIAYGPGQNEVAAEIVRRLNAHPVPEQDGWRDTISCAHEAYQGSCAHCGVRIENGRALRPPLPEQEAV